MRKINNKSNKNNKRLMILSEFQNYDTNNLNVSIILSNPCIYKIENSQPTVIWRL